MHELFVNHLLAFVFGSIWSVYLFTLLSVFIPYTRLWFFFLSLSPPSDRNVMPCPLITFVLQISLNDYGLV